jgi:four helix bundle protein
MADYRKTKTYLQAEEIYKFTKRFGEKFLHQIKDARLIDQMVSSARSVKQNLVEGATRNSVKDYIRFIGFSRASGEELLEDYRDLAGD